MSKVGVVVPAAGMGQRMGAGHNKVFLKLHGCPILIHTLRILASWKQTREIVIAAKADEISEIKALVKAYEIAKVSQIVTGGKTRQESVYSGLKSLQPDTEWVFIHDAARPFISHGLLDKLHQRVQEVKAVGVGIPVKDTIKFVEQGKISNTPPRSLLWSVQTPQVFSYPLIMQAHQGAVNQNWQGTDDLSLVENMSVPVYLVEGDEKNIKITTPDDLVIAQSLMDDRKGESHVIGMGYDVHQFVEGRPLWLGGVKVDHPYGLLGHSDADVVLHALMDALLGAGGLGDIGQHFPDTNPKYKDISSVILLNHVKQLLTDKGWQVENADITIAAQKPKLAPYIPQMRKVIANTLATPYERINVKATTTERLGFVGREEGVESFAVTSLKPL